MPASETFVIIGAGLAGAKAAEALRAEGFDGRLVLMGDEAERPYDRPPLSKDYLQGKSEKDKIYLHPSGWYTDHDVDLRLDTVVTAIDPPSHQVIAAGGERIDYHKLLVSTGSSPRHLSLPGADLDGVLYLRGVADCEAIKEA
ncbi:MAG: FAD-dependent oxidoreductase, partial [Actinomycetota bacterium]|nr:FAD-dependent oxidoreductase [Actinomycetota bacterium]